jgi:hypothetical protein
MEKHMKNDDMKENYDDSAAGRLVYSYDAAPQLQAMPDAVIAPRSASFASREIMFSQPP